MIQIRSLRDLKEVLIISILTIFVLFVGERLGLWEPGGDLDNLIYEAAESGDIEAVKQHLADGTDIELKCTGCGSTALGHAAKYGHNEIAELLIENGADVDAKDEDGSTPLHLAALMGRKEIAELLIENGADVNAKAMDGGTPLHYAATKEIAELLISKGADVNAKNEKGEAPLDWANDPNWPNDTAKTANLLRKHGGKTSEELKAEGK